MAVGTRCAVSAGDGGIVFCGNIPLRFFNVNFRELTVNCGRRDTACRVRRRRWYCLLRTCASVVLNVNCRELTVNYRELWPYDIPETVFLFNMNYQE